MVTLKEIANLTGVSLNTVSRALKDMPDIGVKTKERIRQAANTLGYTPNILARGLAMRKTFTIGLIATELENPARSMFITALRQLALSNGYQLLVSGYGSDTEIEGCIREMNSRGVDGIILGNVDGILSEKSYWPVLDTVMRSGTPVAVFYHVITTKVDNLFADYRSAAFELTNHLIQVHALRNILYAGASMSYERCGGYRQAMEHAGLADQAGHLPLPGWTTAHARSGIINYLKQNPVPEGLICHNDLTAIGVIAGLRDCGYRVPEQIAVVGIDNIDLADYLNPRLTTAGIAPDAVAKGLISLLLDRIEGKTKDDGKQISLPFEICYRESCGCGKKNDPNQE